jgi:hypothetical protein
LQSTPFHLDQGNGLEVLFTEIKIILPMSKQIEI